MNQETKLTEEKQLKRAQEIVADLVIGKSQREIARRWGCHYNTIWKFAHRSDIKAKVESLRTSLANKLREGVYD